MPKNKTQAEIEYAKQERRIARAIRELTAQGYSITFKKPQRPKRITQKSVEKLKKVTRTTIRKGGHYTDPTTGEYKKAEQAFKEKRSQAAKKSAETRKKNKETSYLPSKNNVVINNFIKETGRFFFSKAELEEVLNTIFAAPSDFRWTYGRSKNPTIRARAIEASETCSNRLINYINSIINADKKIYMNVNKTTFGEELERTLFGYNEEEVKLGFNSVMRFLGNKVLSIAEDYEEDEYDEI